MTNYAEILKSENVLILDESSFNSKIKKIQSDGVKSLQCVFDFDATISKAFHKGEKVNKSTKYQEFIPGGSTWFMLNFMCRHNLVTIVWKIFYQMTKRDFLML